MAELDREHYAGRIAELTHAVANGDLIVSTGLRVILSHAEAGAFKLGLTPTHPVFERLLLAEARAAGRNWTAQTHCGAAKAVVIRCSGWGLRWPGMPAALSECARRGS